MNSLRQSTVEPVFFKNQDVYTESHNLKTLEVCEAVADIVGQTNVDGAQNVWGLWRIYLTSVESRVSLLTKGLSIRGRTVTLFDKSPRATNVHSQNVEKIVIRDVPLSVDNDLIMEYLRKFEHLKLTSDVRYSRERSEDGFLTKYRNGDRYIFAEAPVFPVLPNNDKIDIFNARISHPTQRDICKVCHLRGHSANQAACLALDLDIKTTCFKGHENPLSNMYPCHIECFGETFKSSEEAFQWKKAIDLSREDIAAEIKTSKHAGAAKAISHKLERNGRDQVIDWETKVGCKVMKELISHKFDQVIDFRESLIRTKGTVLMETTNDLFWAVGLPAHLARHCNPDYWPGKNTLASIMEEVRQEQYDIMVDHNELVNELGKQSHLEMLQVNDVETLRQSGVYFGDESSLQAPPVDQSSNTPFNDETICESEVLSGDDQNANGESCHETESVEKAQECLEPTETVQSATLGDLKPIDTAASNVVDFDDSFANLSIPPLAQGTPIKTNKKINKKNKLGKTLHAFGFGKRQMSSPEDVRATKSVRTDSDATSETFEPP